MNAERVSSQSRRFVPPVTGLWPGERIVWIRRPGTGFWITCFGILLVLSIISLPFTIASDLGLSGAAPPLFAAVGGIVIFMYFYIVRRRTRYYLTDERIIEVRGDRIVKEMSLERFAGRPMGQFLESRVTHTVNNMPMYDIRIYDPLSDETMVLKSLDGFSASWLEEIGKIRECRYCGLENVAIAGKCKNCGAVL